MTFIDPFIAKHECLEERIFKLFNGKDLREQLILCPCTLSSEPWPKLELPTTRRSSRCRWLTSPKMVKERNQIKNSIVMFKKWWSGTLDGRRKIMQHFPRQFKIHDLPWSCDMFTKLTIAGYLQRMAYASVVDLKYYKHKFVEHSYIFTENLISPAMTDTPRRWTCCIAGVHDRITCLANILL